MATEFLCCRWYAPYVASRQICLSLLAGTVKVDQCFTSSIVIIVLVLCFLLALALLKCRQRCAETRLLMALNWIWFLVLSRSYMDPSMVSMQMVFLVNLYLNLFNLTHSTVKKSLVSIPTLKNNVLITKLDPPAHLLCPYLPIKSLLLWSFGGFCCSMLLLC
jgi:hypothetical protein